MEKDEDLKNKEIEEFLQVIGHFVIHKIDQLFDKQAGFSFHLFERSGVMESKTISNVDYKDLAKLLREIAESMESQFSDNDFKTNNPKLFYSDQEGNA